MKQTSAGLDWPQSEIHRSILIERSKRYPPRNPISPNIRAIRPICTIGYPCTTINLPFAVGSDWRGRALRPVLLLERPNQRRPLSLRSWASANARRVGTTSSAPATSTFCCRPLGNSHGSPICARPGGRRLAPASQEASRPSQLGTGKSRSVKCDNYERNTYNCTKQNWEFVTSFVTFARSECWRQKKVQYRELCPATILNRRTAAGA